MNAKHNLITLGMASALLALPAAPAFAWSSVEYVKARVVNVEPIMQTVQVRGPGRRVCWTQEQTRQIRRPVSNPDSIGNTVIGAVLGGIAGYQFGHGHGRNAPAVAGALLGGAIANNMSNGYSQSYTETIPVERCKIKHRYRTVEQIVGYRVSYLYQGEVFTTRMNHRPKRFIRLRVSERVTPVN